MSELLVLKPGLLTTVQDRGRWGWQASGVPVAGPMDPWAHRLANALAGNDPDAATLETTLLGPEVEFEDARVVAVAGAEFELLVDGERVPTHAAFRVAAGSTLRFGHRALGARAYLAVSGGITVPPVLGSRATHITSAMGGVGGRAIRIGDRLPLGEPSSGRKPPVAIARVPTLAVPDGHADVRVMAGPQEDAFTADALDRLQSAPYTIGRASDRMGYRLEGPAVAHARGGDIISEATAMGTLQVPASGQPILLMADRQTTGGYPKIATVITADLGLAGQLAPGDQISFVVCSLREAIAALVARERALMAVEGATAP